MDGSVNLNQQQEDEIALRAKMRHEHILAKRARAQALQKDLRAMQAELRGLALEMHGKMREINRRAAEMAGKISAYLDGLIQEETTIRLPTLPDPQRAETDRQRR